MDDEEKEFLVRIDRELITIKHDVWLMLGIVIGVGLGLIIIAIGFIN